MKQRISALTSDLQTMSASKAQLEDQIGKLKLNSSAIREKLRHAEAANDHLKLELDHLPMPAPIMASPVKVTPPDNSSAMRRLEADLDRLTAPAEMAVIKALASWPRLVVSAAQAHEPHRVAFFMMELAAAFHALWTAGRETPELRFICDDDAGLTAARLYLVKATALVIRSGLGVLSITAREEM